MTARAATGARRADRAVQRRTRRFSGPGRHSGVPWYTIHPAGPAAEFCRSAREPAAAFVGDDGVCGSAERLDGERRGPRLPVPPLVLRRLRIAVLTLAAASALLGAWAAWHYPRTTHWSAEKLTCAALLGGASWAALFAGAGGLVVQAGSPPQAESKALWVVLGCCLARGLYFGMPRQ